MLTESFHDACNLKEHHQFPILQYVGTGCRYVWQLRSTTMLDGVRRKEMRRWNQNKLAPSGAVRSHTMALFWSISLLLIIKRFAMSFLCICRVQLKLFWVGKNYTKQPYFKNLSLYGLCLNQRRVES